MKRVDTEAFALRSYNLVEASRIIVCLTPEYGIVRGVATGARRLRSQFGASFEPFTLIQLSYYEKEGQELVSIRGAEIQKSFFNLAGDRRMTQALGRFGQLLMEFATPAEPNQNLFRMVKACLLAIEKEIAQAPRAVLYFEIWLLKLTGFMPSWANCSECGNSLDPGPAWIESELNVLCVDCRSGRGLLVSKPVLWLFRAAQKLPPERFLQTTGAALAEPVADAFEITSYLINAVLTPKTLPRMSFTRDGSELDVTASPSDLNLSHA
jgi:DNA repair protein RecO (recombination protein O)